jgi:hypothetical protein
LQVKIFKSSLGDTTRLPENEARKDAENRPAVAGCGKGLGETQREPDRRPPEHKTIPETPGHFKGRKPEQGNASDVG